MGTIGATESTVGWASDSGLSTASLLVGAVGSATKVGDGRPVDGWGVVGVGIAIYGYSEW